MRTILVIAAMLTVAGCQTGQPGEGGDGGGNDGIGCTEIFVYGVNVSVSDDADQPITDAVLTLADGDYAETMEELADGEYAGAGERAGTYTLVVEAEGFETATVEDIEVNEDECHVIPEVRAVTLMPI